LTPAFRAGTGGGGFDNPRALPGSGGGNDDDGGGVGILARSKGGGTLKTCFWVSFGGGLRIGTRGGAAGLSSRSSGILGGRAGDDNGGGTGRRRGGKGVTGDGS
jgi:hypothetical protein